ncbi:hypothetical protein RND71_043677 [Anisodus tanguticus]|uniref:Homeobox domain-containing protein n=1 Tax=Anisodus tanguticus TaxID=243964 RepID=A0AAE1UR05_9SOLA|nr:hypothetical protein RND71_043677 [Anisodus tanguticus]
MNSISPSYLHPIGGSSNSVAHFNSINSINSHNHSAHNSLPAFPSSSNSINLQQPSFGQNQYTSLNHHNNHSSSDFSSNSFQLNLPSPFDEECYSSTQRFQHNSLGINHSSSNLKSYSLMPNESCNSSGDSSLSSSSPVSIASSSPEAKFNFYPNSNPNYMNYINQNCSFNNLTRSQYEEDDYIIRDDEEDDLSVSHYDIKYTPNGIGYEPLPGKTRTRDKYRVVYTENQRTELENEYSLNKYISIGLKFQVLFKMFLHANSISTMNSISPSYLHPIGGPSNPVAHHFNSHHHATHHNSSSFTSSSFPLNLQQPSFDQNQFSNIHHHNNHSSSAFSSNSFQLNLPSPFDKESYPPSHHLQHNSLGINQSNCNLNSHSLMPNESCNSSGGSSLSSSSPISTTSSSPEAKFNFLPNNQSNYLNYLNQNCSFPNSTPSHLQNGSNLNLQQFNSFNNLTRSQYEEDDFMMRDDEEDDLSVSHYDIKYMHYGPGSEPLPGKTRTRDKYRIVYTENQRTELENEYLLNKYISIGRKSEIAKKLQLSERQIKIWFQNRRAKDRKQQTKKHQDI